MKGKYIDNIILSKHKNMYPYFQPDERKKRTETRTKSRTRN